MSKLNTRDSLLVAAEQLIAHKGYANTSLRDITAQANANIAAVNYHFGSKEGMVAAMLSRRMKPLNKERLVLLELELDAARKENRRPDPEKLLRAFIEPVIAFFQVQAQGNDFLRILSHLHSDPDDAIRQEFLKHMVPVFLSYFKGFKAALPDVAPELLVSRIFFCIGAMVHGASLLVDDDIREHGAKSGLPAMADSKTIVEELIGFVLRGVAGK